MLRLAGKNGVAAITILLYSQFLFNALFLGFSMGVAPVISYNYGAKKYRRTEKRLQNLQTLRDRFFYYNYYLL